MQTTTNNTEKTCNFVGIKDTMNVIPKLDPFDMDEVIVELKTGMEKIMHLVKRGYLFNEDTATFLAAKGEIDLLKFCLQELECPVDSEAYNRAAERGHLECMKLLESYSHNHADALYRAIASGEVEVVKYIVETHHPSGLDFEKLCSHQTEGGFPEMKAYLKSMFGV
ncbi:Ankyrin repeat-containing domain [Cedratvirus A11]|uniref:Ankyrin repeat-containing domain n=1 Tax=Cedratvirus A11 TaxID=1903266 RepID=A0A1M7XTW3_9VIRU|nr:Ankyrin repeat-containing domain [Cedratvirus A11]SHO33112.1 Ankyrin repeat-containing domain [Cedratvirus A11]